MPNLIQTFRTKEIINDRDSIWTGDIQRRILELETWFTMLKGMLEEMGWRFNGDRGVKFMDAKVQNDNPYGLLADAATWESGTDNDGIAWELDHLKKLEAEGKVYTSWEDTIIIQKDHFFDHIKAEIDSSYYVDKMEGWPWNHLVFDYEAAAAEARKDYAEINFGDEVYLIKT